MKRSDAVKKYKAIDSVSGLSGIKFAHAMIVAKNKLDEFVNPVIKIQEIMSNPSNAQKEFLMAQSDIIENKDLTRIEIEAQVNALVEANSETTDELKKWDDEYRDLMNEEVDEIKFGKLDIEFVPEDISVKGLDGIQFLIKGLT